MPAVGLATQNGPNTIVLDNCRGLHRFTEADNMRNHSIQNYLEPIMTGLTIDPHIMWATDRKNLLSDWWHNNTMMVTIAHRVSCCYYECCVTIYLIVVV